MISWSIDHIKIASEDVFIHNNKIRCQECGCNKILEFRVHTADDLSWLSAPSSSPKPSAISRIKLCATLMLIRSPACSKTLFMVCTKTEENKGSAVKNQLKMFDNIYTSAHVITWMNPLIARCKLLCKFNPLLDGATDLDYRDGDTSGRGWDIS